MGRPYGKIFGVKGKFLSRELSLFGAPEPLSGSLGTAITQFLKLSLTLYKN